LVRGVGSAAPLWILTVPELPLAAEATSAAAKLARITSARTTRASTLPLLILPLAIGPHPLSLRGFVSRSREVASYPVWAYGMRRSSGKTSVNLDRMGTTTIGGLHSTGAGWMQRGG
jgi:hypothetical protein